jgi:hypothetical protein
MKRIRGMKSNKEKSRLIRFLSNPLFGFISAILAIISLILVIYFYSEEKSKRELKYYCHPVKATVVKAGHTASLEVFCENEKIKSDVTAVQVAIWNHGKKPIKKEDILEPIILYTEPNTLIIDVAIRKQTREVINLNIDRNFFKEGFIPVSWQILEHNDGGILQIIFAGSSDVEILAKGTIEGQRSIKRIKYAGKIKTPSEQIKYEVAEYKIAGFVLLVNGILMFFILIFSIVKKPKSEKLYEEIEKADDEKLRAKVLEEFEIELEKERNLFDRIISSKAFIKTFFLIGGICSFIASVYFFLKSGAIGPPFGF